MADPDETLAKALTGPSEVRCGPDGVGEIDAGLLFPPEPNYYIDADREGMAA